MSATEPKLVVELNCFTHMCNLACVYCTDTSDYTVEGGVCVSAGLPAVFEPGSRFRAAVERVAVEVRARHDPAVLKILGGEVFLIRGIADLVSYCAERFPVVQVTTNGLLLHDHLERLVSIPNLHVQVTLDGHEPRLNCARFTDGAAIERVLDDVGRLCAAGVPVELLAVLSECNAGGLLRYVEHLAHRFERLTFLPFAVRWTRRVGLGRDAHAIDVAELLARFSELSHVLGPRAYYEALLEFLRSGRRARPCFVPDAIAGVSPDLARRLPCPCIPAWSADPPSRGEGGAPRPPPRTWGALVSGLCRSCFDHFDVYNVALGANDDDADLRRLALFQEEAVWSRVDALRRPNGSPSSS